MSKIVIVDTDILIDAGRNIPEAVTYLEDIREQASLAISAITQMELMVGCRNKEELNAVDIFVRHFSILPINKPITEKAVELIRQYRLSHGLLIADALIAATAITTEAEFVSKNQRHYRFIKGLNLLSYPKT